MQLGSEAVYLRSELKTGYPPGGLQQGDTPSDLEVTCLSPQTDILVLFTTQPVAESAPSQNIFVMSPLGLSVSR